MCSGPTVDRCRIDLPDDDDHDRIDRSASATDSIEHSAAATDDRDQRIARLKALVPGLTTAGELVSTPAPHTTSGDPGQPALAEHPSVQRALTKKRSRRQKLLAALQDSVNKTQRRVKSRSPVNPAPGHASPFRQPATNNRQPRTDNQPPTTPRDFARRHARPVAGVRYSYKPRKPEHSVIRQVISENLDSFLDGAEQASGGHRFPGFVIDELRDMLACGDVRRGLALFRCRKCNAGRAVPLSCKSRAVCTSCGAKRMTLLAAKLVDNTIPFAPIRFWVMTFPPWLRRIIAYNHELYRELIGIVDRHICMFYQQQAEQAGIQDGLTGSVHFKQLCGSAINANPHNHAGYLDGVFYRSEKEQGDTLVFCSAQPPADEDIFFILSKVRSEVLELLRDRGILKQDPENDSLAEQAPLLSTCLDASIQNLIALGPRAGKRAVRLGADPLAKWSGASIENHGRMRGNYDGFDLHAAQLIAADDREGLERALRYCARPPLSEQRLSILPDGRIKLKLKKTWSDGSSAVVFTPEEFLERLAVLIPRPEINLLIYRGVLAPNHKLRSRVVAYGRLHQSIIASEPGDAKTCPSLITIYPSSDPQNPLDRLNSAPGQLWLVAQDQDPGAALSLQTFGLDTQDGEQSPKQKNYTWSSLMRRAFDIDVLQCPRPGCSGRLRFIARVTEPAEIVAILRSLGMADSTVSTTSAFDGGVPNPRAPPLRPAPIRSRYGPLFDKVA